MNQTPKSKRWRNALFVILTTASLRPIRAGAAPLFVAVAAENRLVMMVGKYDNGRWVSSDDFYSPPEPRDLFTLYGPEGEAAVVAIDDEERAVRNRSFAEWRASVTRWDNRKTPYAVALSGDKPTVGTSSASIDVKDPMYVAIVARYLKSKNLDVPSPSVTEAFNIPVSIPNHGVEEVVLIAHSDAKALKDEETAAVYAVALVWWNDHGKEKIYPLESQTFFKPAHQSIDEFERYHGKRDYLRFLTAQDIDGDGQKEIAILVSKETGFQTDIFSFQKNELKKVLSFFKFNFN